MPRNGRCGAGLELRGLHGPSRPRAAPDRLQPRTAARRLADPHLESGREGLFPFRVPNGSVFFMRSLYSTEGSGYGNRIGFGCLRASQAELEGTFKGQPSNSPAMNRDTAAPPGAQSLALGIARDGASTASPHSRFQRLAALPCVSLSASPAVLCSCWLLSVFGRVSPIRTVFGTVVMLITSWERRLLFLNPQKRVWEIE